MAVMSAMTTSVMTAAVVAAIAGRIIVDVQRVMGYVQRVVVDVQ